MTSSDFNFIDYSSWECIGGGPSPSATRSAKPPIGRIDERVQVISCAARSPIYWSFSGPGEQSVLGVAVVGTQPYTLTAEALDGAELSLLTSEDFIHLMKTEPSLSFRVLQVLAEEVRFGRVALSHL
jgi:hypothetical protein